MENQKHSGLGIASFITSIVSGILIFLVIVIAGVMEASSPGGMDEESTSAVMVGLFLFAFLGAALIALGLGIAGLLQKERKKILLSWALCSQLYHFWSQSFSLSLG